MNLGKDIVTSEEDGIATEAIVFMLVGLRGHWKISHSVCTYCLDKRQSHRVCTYCLDKRQ